MGSVTPLEVRRRKRRWRWFVIGEKVKAEARKEPRAKKESMVPANRYELIQPGTVQQHGTVRYEIDYSSSAV